MKTQLDRFNSVLKTKTSINCINWILHISRFHAISNTNGFYSTFHHQLPIPIHPNRLLGYEVCDPVWAHAILNYVVCRNRYFFGSSTPTMETHFTSVCVGIQIVMDGVYINLWSQHWERERDWRAIKVGRWVEPRKPCGALWMSHGSTAQRAGCCREEGGVLS